MFSRFRLAPALFASGVLLFGIVTPVFASDRVEGPQAPAIHLAMAATVPLLPLAEVSVPAPAPTLAEAAQTRPLDMAIPFERAGFGSTSLRRSLYVSFGALQVLDALSTRNALNAGAREANPAMAGIVKNSAALFAVKAGTAAATTYFVERMAKKNPRRATIVMAVLNTAYVAIVAHNYRVARSQ